MKDTTHKLGDVGTVKPQTPETIAEQITKLTAEVIAAKAEIENLKRANQALEVTVRVQSKFLAALPL